jgi:hypothetical protein
MLTSCDNILGKKHIRYMLFYSKKLKFTHLIYMVQKKLACILKYPYRAQR